MSDYEKAIHKIGKATIYKQDKIKSLEEKIKLLEEKLSIEMDASLTNLKAAYELGEELGLAEQKIRLLESKNNKLNTLNENRKEVIEDLTLSISNKNIELSEIKSELAKERNKSELLEEDLECIEMYLTSIGLPLNDEAAKLSTIGRIKLIVKDLRYYGNERNWIATNKTIKYNKIETLLKTVDQRGKVESIGFRTAQKYYRERKAKLRSREDCENPFEPGDQDYEDFWDGWCHEEDAYNLEKFRKLNQGKNRCVDEKKP